MLFDNTLSVKQEAERIRKSVALDKIIIGNESQLFSIGQKVNANGISSAIVTNSWTENGFVYYTIEWKVKGKFYSANKRQKDLS